MPSLSTRATRSPVGATVAVSKSPNEAQPTGRSSSPPMRRQPWATSYMDTRRTTPTTQRRQRAHRPGPNPHPHPRDGPRCIQPRSAEPGVPEGCLRTRGPSQSTSWATTLCPRIGREPCETSPRRSFYEGCRLPQEVVTTVRNASAGALELVPYYRWLAEQKNLTSPPRCGPVPAKSWVPPASLLRLMNPTDQPPDPTARRKSHSATLTMWPEATPHSHVVSVSRHLLSISTSPDTRACSAEAPDRTHIAVSYPHCGQPCA